MGKQAELLRASPEALDAAIRSIEIDPKVPVFLSFCKRQHIDVAVVSEGFDRVVRSVLERAQISVPFFANKLIWRGRDRWSLAFPHAQSIAARTVPIANVLTEGAARDAL